jgi:serine/threonine-protein kinase HipA
MIRSGASIVVEVLTAWLGDKRIGEIRRIPRDLTRVRFVVDSTYSGPVAALSEGFSLQAGREVDIEQATNFLGGYVPEGQNRIRLAARKGIDASDLFGLLENYGLTLAGALSVRTDDPTDNEAGAYRLLSDRELTKKIQKTVEEYDLGNEPDSGRSALPGFQPKLLLGRFDGTWFQPERRAHSTHIIKPARTNRPALIAEEFYSHELSRHMGLSSFGSELLTVNGNTFLAIERYDRRIVGSQKVELIHQEDAAQILSLDWKNDKAKFQDPALPNRRDRPTAARIAEIFGSSGTDEDADLWLRYLTYNILVGNHDGHAKNVSLLHVGGISRIAEMYDAVPLLHINDEPGRRGSRKEADELSLSINGEFQHHSVTRADLAAEAGSWGIRSGRQIESVLDDTFERFANALDATSLPSGASPGLDNRLQYNLDRLGDGKSIGKPKLPIAARQQRRVGKGIPAGGQYAAFERPESDVHLS